MWKILLAAQLCHLLRGIGLTIAKIRSQRLQSIHTLALDNCFSAPPALATFAAVQSFLKYPGVTVVLWSNVMPDPDLLKSQDRKGALWGYIFACFGALGCYCRKLKLPICEHFRTSTNL